MSNAPLLEPNQD